MKERNIVISRKQMNEILKNNKFEKSCRTIYMILSIVMTFCTFSLIFNIICSELSKTNFFRISTTMTFTIIIATIVKHFQIKNSLTVCEKFLENNTIEK